MSKNSDVILLLIENKFKLFYFFMIFYESKKNIGFLILHQRCPWRRCRYRTAAAMAVTTWQRQNFFENIEMTFLKERQNSRRKFNLLSI